MGGFRGGFAGDVPPQIPMSMVGDVRVVVGYENECVGTGKECVVVGCPCLVAATVREIPDAL